jgi:CBS domain-containing protein
VEGSTAIWASSPGDDIIIAISNSGETHELNLIVRSVREIGGALIVFTGNPRSSLAATSDIVIDVGVEKEACPFGLAPTSSSTATLAMGDALAVALIDKRNFNEKDFYKFHPGGNLGSRLRARVRDIMIQGRQIPRIPSGTSISRAVQVMDERNKGFVLVTDRRDPAGDPHRRRPAEADPQRQIRRPTAHRHRHDPKSQTHRRKPLSGGRYRGHATGRDHDLRGGERKQQAPGLYPPP